MRQSQANTELGFLAVSQLWSLVHAWCGERTQDSHHHCSQCTVACEDQERIYIQKLQEWSGFDVAIEEDMSPKGSVSEPFPGLKECFSLKVVDAAV